MEQPRPQHDLIYRHLRELIGSGQLPRGERLPSMKHLADRWGANVLTVHKAFGRLAREGLVTRVNRVGTFVARDMKRLTHAAIYDMGDNRGMGGSRFQRALHAAIRDEWHREGVQTDVWVDPRPLDQADGTWQALATAAERRQFQALVVTSADWPHVHWLRKLPVPVTFVASASIPNVVMWDLDRFARLSLRALRRRGCRSVGLIGALSPRFDNPDGSRSAETLFFQRFTDTCGELGLELRNGWIRTAPKPALSPHEHEPFGYEEFNALWRNQERPDGLVVYPDSIVPGVLLALARAGVDVPRVLKLVLHKNEELDLFTPYPASFVVSSARECAAAVRAQIEMQLRGEPAAPIRLGFRVVEYPPRRAERSAQQGRMGEL